MTYPKVKPCPHCGEEPLLFGYEGHNGGISSWRVECDPCDYIGSCEGRKLDAIRRHNERCQARCGDEGAPLCPACSVPAHELTQTPGCGGPLALAKSEPRS